MPTITPGSLIVLGADGLGEIVAPGDLGTWQPTLPLYLQDAALIMSSSAAAVWSIADLVWLNASSPATAIGLPVSTGTFSDNRVIWPGAVTTCKGDPMILNSGLLCDLTGDPNTVLWTDGFDTTVASLLVIGV